MVNNKKEIVSNASILNTKLPMSAVLSVCVFVHDSMFQFVILSHFRISLSFHRMSLTKVVAYVSWVKKKFWESSPGIFSPQAPPEELDRTFKAGTF